MEAAPQYAQTPSFTALSALCRRAGMYIQFVELPQGMYARSRDQLIQMPTDNRFSTKEHPTIVLGHELAHFFVNKKYYKTEDEKLTMAQYVQLEAECDQLGAFLYMLAEQIVDHDSRVALGLAEKPEA